MFAHIRARNSYSHTPTTLITTLCLSIISFFLSYEWFFLSFFLGWRIPNLITEQADGERLTNHVPNKLPRTIADLDARLTRWCQ